MKRELSTTDAFEKKKTHVAWFSLVLIAFCISYDGKPIKIPGVDTQLPVRSAILLLTMLVVYSTVSFWFESRRIIRLNSHLVAGKAISDTVAEVRAKLEQCEVFLDQIMNFRFEPMPNDGMKPIFERFRERCATIRLTLRGRSQYLQNAVNGITRVEGFNQEAAKQEIVAFDQLMTTLKDYEDKLSEFPFDEADPVMAANKARDRAEEALAGFRVNLDQSIKAFTDNLLRLSDDILTEGKLQWGFLERWPPFILGCSAALAGIVFLAWPHAALAARRVLVG